VWLSLIRIPFEVAKLAIIDRATREWSEHSAEIPFEDRERSRVFQELIAGLSRVNRATRDSTSVRACRMFQKWAAGSLPVCDDNSRDEPNEVFFKFGAA
jgi:hypothetical protein